jgi:hypothetical protein
MIGVRRARGGLYRNVSHIEGGGRRRRTVIAKQTGKLKKKLRRVSLLPLSSFLLSSLLSSLSLASSTLFSLSLSSYHASNTERTVIAWTTRICRSKFRGTICKESRTRREEAA